MSQRQQPSRAFQVRDAHRRSLTWHFAALSIGVVGLFALNRMLTPETFWAHWVALGWLAVFLVHLAHFARGTLESMGAWRHKRKGHPTPEEDVGPAETALPEPGEHPTR
jgi:hypothetical protein